MNYTHVCDIIDGRVTYRVNGTLGFAEAEGPVSEFGRVRDAAKWAAGYRNEP